MSGRLKVSDGDWICTAKDCENLNFARREKCNKCGEPKAPSMIVKNTGTEIGQRFAEKSKGLFSANDWQCNKCGNINWARRNTCNVCNAPKVGPEEQRTGYGGGFKENENVTYREKEDSDGEFDEFGRKKKKYRGKIPAVQTVIENPIMKAAPDDVGDEEEDDDEDDIDLSKYALSDDSDNDGVDVPTTKVQKRRNSRSPSGSPKRRRSNSGSSSSSSGSSSSSSSSRSGSYKKSRSRTRSRSPRGYRR